MWLTGPRSVLVLAFAIALAVSACSASEVATSAPTQVLIPSTATYTPIPITPTSIPLDLPAPSDLVVTVSVIGDLDNFDLVADSTLVQKVINNLADLLSVDPAVVQLVHVDGAVWPVDGLGCDGDDYLRRGQVVDGFRLRLVVGNILYEYHTDSTSRLLRCQGEDVVRGELLLELDPIASELLTLARQQVAQELDLPTRRIRLVDVTLVRWTESSLGCPLSGQTYTPVSVDGYRIVVAAGNNEYIFHTDSTRLLGCDPDLEQMPD